jgi:2-polyprenyl-3-methyl-5-hydroxy-6-metoxy-1,4-benzoquinol methylase
MKKIHKTKMKEPQYQFLLKLREKEGLNALGLMTSQLYRDDPRHLVFQLSRYKFVAKMFSGLKNVLEVGCGDGFSTKLILQEVSHVTGIDFDPVFIEAARSLHRTKKGLRFLVWDICKDGAMDEKYNGIFSCDVIEHIPKKLENRFLKNIVLSLAPDGVFLCGTPSLASQAYASAPSRQGHVNCKDAPALKKLMLRHFRNVFIFSMNDEVVHTGFHSMAHYLFALCCVPKK